MHNFDSLILNTGNILFFDVVLNVLLAGFIGFIISLVYRYTHQGNAYSSSFVTVLIIITMITSIVIMVIGNNLARAFGLVGAMSIIRFRTVLKETRDIVFIFFALASGMAVGSGNHMIGVVGCIIISLVILILFYIKYGSVQLKEMLLKFWVIPEEGDRPVYMNVFDEYLNKYSLLNVRSTRLGQFLELSFYVKIKKKGQYQSFITALGALEGIDKVSIVVSDSEDSFS